MLDEIQTKLAKARKRLERVEAMRHSLNAEIADLEAAIRVIENLGQPDNALTTPKITVSDRIVSALETLAFPLSKAELHLELERTGEPIKPTTLTGTLQRMSETHEVFYKDGKWFLAKWKNSPEALATEETDGDSIGTRHPRRSPSN